MPRRRRRPHRPRGALRAVAAAVVLAASCDRQPAPAPLPPKASVVPVTLSEFRIDHPPVGRGRTIFRVKNGGHLRHELDLVSLPEDLPPVDVQIRSSERRLVDAVATMAPRAPGAAGTFAAELAPGRYAMICFLDDGGGEQHAFKGMISEFRVT